MSGGGTIPRTESGEVRYDATRHRGSRYWCHCQSCSKHSGAPASVFVAFEYTAYRVTQGEITKSDSTPGRTRRGFCARCGSTLTCENAGPPTETYFHVAAFDRAAELQPARHVFREEQPPGCAWTRPTARPERQARWGRPVGHHSFASPVKDHAVVIRGLVWCRIRPADATIAATSRVSIRISAPGPRGRPSTTVFARTTVPIDDPESPAEFEDQRDGARQADLIRDPVKGIGEENVIDRLGYNRVDRHGVRHNEITVGRPPLPQLASARDPP
jgi:hypothetical protein